ncbi:MAG: fructose-1,6-bisphosphatase [Cetobacterium sp.]
MKVVEDRELKYLQLLGQNFPTIGATATEIINLKAILNLPKGTEHFVSDLHGEFEAFDHVIRNGSGVIREKIDLIFSRSLREEEKKQLATVIYYPKEKIREIIKSEENIDEWYRITIDRLLQILRVVSSKYTSSKVRKALPEDFAYIIQELLYERDGVPNKLEYVAEIVETIIAIGRGQYFIEALSNVIQRLIVDKLHVLGDIYDRGPAPHLIMDRLMKHHNVDIQWGNHDILWMGASAGQLGCIANVVRICTRYSNRDILEEVYGINLLPLATFAMEVYGNDSCECFMPKDRCLYKKRDIDLISKMHKAISIIQFKIEGEIIDRNPQFHMENRKLLHRINLEKGIITIDGKDYKLKDKYFPTMDINNPYKLTEEEKEIIIKLQNSFLRSEKLQNHMSFLFSKGSMYLRYNGNLLYHGCIPLKETGELQEVEILGEILKGKDYLDTCDTICRKGYFGKCKDTDKYKDYFWYFWCGRYSPLFGKNSMKTFERYFVEDKITHKERKNFYYDFYDNEMVFENILENFGLSKKKSRIINGHVPVKSKDGENPIKAKGKLLVIDGGFSKAYQEETGHGGYTLIYNSQTLKIVSHEPFTCRENAIKDCTDIHSTAVTIERSIDRIRVGDTDVGRELKEQIIDLEKLLLAYRKGLVKERIK